MKTLVASIFIFSLVSFGLLAQNKQNKNDSISFDKITYDYGTIELGSSGKSEFKFTNRMKTPLIVSNVKPTCGCTVADWTKEPILPGKTGLIKLSYNTKIPGTFQKSITVTSNAVNASVILTIKGVVNPAK